MNAPLSPAVMLDMIKRERDRRDAQRDLLSFTRQSFDIIEPGQDFCDNWHLHVIAEHLMAVTSGEVRNLVINIPPGCMKSILTSVAWPAWEWANDPTLRIMGASYGADLAIRDASKTRDIITSEWFQERWPEVKIKLGSDQKTKYELTGGGWRMATSVDGRATGEHPDRKIVDDPHNAKQAESDAERESALTWFDRTLSTRGQSRGASTVVVMQRLHEKDVTGHILADLTGYTHLCIPMEYDGVKRKTFLGAYDPRTKVGELFTIPVICGAALLSFAHGSNDVANAIGPLAAIHQAVGGGALGDKSPLPLWVLVIGAAGISVGLLLYGPRLIRTVGTEITKLNRVRAFCITLSAAITVIIASTMGLPVSSTHIAIGALFGVGFLREYLANKSASVPKLPEPETPPRPQGLRPPKDPRIAAEKLRRRYLVRRSHMITIVAAWIITVPVTGIIAAALAWVIDASNLINLE